MEITVNVHESMLSLKLVFWTSNGRHVIKYDLYVTFPRIFAHNVQINAKFCCKNFNDVCQVFRILHHYTWGGVFSCIYGVHIGGIWQIRLNHPCAVVMQPYVKLLWPLVWYWHRKAGIKWSNIPSLGSWLENYSLAKYPFLVHVQILEGIGIVAFIPALWRQYCIHTHCTVLLNMEHLHQYLSPSEPKVNISDSCVGFHSGCEVTSAGGLCSWSCWGIVSVRRTKRWRRSRSSLPVCRWTENDLRRNWVKCRIKRRPLIDSWDCWNERYVMCPSALLSLWLSGKTSAVCSPSLK